MENYDAYIIVNAGGENNDMNSLEDPDIMKIQKAVTGLSKIYNIKTDIFSAETPYGDMRELRRLINSSLCSIVVVPSGDMSGFMTPIIHTISKNKKLYVLVVDEKSKNVRTEITADGYENVTVSDRTSDADYFKLFSSFIASAQKEMKKLCGYGV